MKALFNSENVTRDRLQQFRHVTDPLADKVITAIIESGQEKQINQILMTLVRNNSFHPGMFASLGPELSGVLDGYIQESGKLPAWADPQRISRGEHLFELYGPEIFMLLNISALPMCYCCGNGAQVLYDTARLLVRDSDTDPLAHRLMETAQMIINVHAPGGLDANGKGVVTIQKVRLIHASIRYFLKHTKGSTPWDTTTLGEPVNQEDLAGTLMSFGPVILAGLKKLGAKLSADDDSAWMHCWNITGYLLGIDEALLPDTFEQGQQLAADILNDQARPSDAGKALTVSCVKFMNSMMAGNAFDNVPPYLIWYFLQDFSALSKKDLAACIGVSGKENLKDVLVLQLAHFISKIIGKAETHDGFVRKIIEAFNKILLQGMIFHYNGNKRVQFFIPPSLQESWGLIDVWKDRASTPAIFGNRITWQQKSEQLNKPA